MSENVKTSEKAGASQKSLIDFKFSQQYVGTSRDKPSWSFKNTAARRRWELMNRLTNLGFSYDEAEALRRIQMTFHRWDEAECGDGNDYMSWSIERDEETRQPFRCYYPHQGESYKVAIPDREAGAQKRLDKIIGARNNRFNCVSGNPDGHVRAYHQSDCRGCALYIVKESDIEGHDINSVYTRGIAVCD